MTDKLKKGTSGLAGAIRKAIGAEADEEVVVTTPQFTRTPGMPAPKEVPRDWESLRSGPSSRLKAMGLGTWACRRSDKTALMLFPGEWFGHIPDGFEVESISGHIKPFVASRSDDDIRFGRLAYGVRVPHDGGFNHDDD